MGLTLGLPQRFVGTGEAVDASRHRKGVSIAPGVHWIGALDPTLRTFDIILRTANGTTHNAYAIRGSDGVAIVDTVKRAFSAEFFERLESVADYDEIRVIVLNHLEPDHRGALPELMRRAPRAQLYISTRATSMLKALLKPKEEYRPFEPEDANTDQRLAGEADSHRRGAGRVPRLRPQHFRGLDRGDERQRSYRLRRPFLTRNRPI